MVATKDQLRNNNWLVYPNPTSDKLSLDQLIGVETISIINLKGVTKLSFEHNQMGDHINLSELPSGLYYVELSGLNSNRVIKIIKQ